MAVCIDCGHSTWQHEPTAACRYCEAKGRLCVYRELEPDPNPFPPMSIFRSKR